MQLLRSTDPAALPGSITFACPNGCRDPQLPSLTQRIEVDLSHTRGDDDLVFLSWNEAVRCPQCRERIAPGAVEEAVQRELGALVR